MALPPELIDEIICYVGSTSRLQPGDEIEQLRREKTDPEGRASLACLRLVNRVFCRCATPLLFRHVDATAGKLSHLRDVSTSPYAGHVRHVGLGMGRAAASDRAQNGQYAGDLASLLAPCLARLPRLRSLAFVGGTSSYRGAELSPEINGSLVRSLKTALSDLDLPRIREMDLGFPSTREFAQLLAGTSSSPGHRIWQLVGRLRHLGLHIQETPTGRPRMRYLRTFRNMLGVAKDLQSLAISSTETVTLANFRIPDSWRLRSLALQGVESTSEKLEEVIGTSRDSLESIELRDVALRSGTRQHVLERAGELPRLTGFRMQSCGYAKTGPSRALRAACVPAPDDPDPIETCHRADFDALGQVQFRVHENRAAAGLRAVDQTTYRFVRRYVGRRDEQRAYERMLADGTLPDPLPPHGL